LALCVTSFVKSRSHDTRKCSNCCEGFEGSGDITFLSHFAVVKAEVTGVGDIFIPKLFTVAGDAGDRGGDIGFIIFLEGESTDQNDLC